MKNDAVHFMTVVSPRLRRRRIAVDPPAAQHLLSHPHRAVPVRHADVSDFPRVLDPRQQTASTGTWERARQGASISVFGRFGEDHWLV